PASTNTCSAPTIRSISFSALSAACSIPVAPLVCPALVPDARFARRKNAVRVQRPLEFLVYGALYRAVAVRDLVHEGRVDAIGAVAFLEELGEQFVEALECRSGLLRVGLVVKHVDDVVHVAPADDELPDVIETVLAEDTVGQFHLL